MLDNIFALLVDTITVVLAGALLLRFWMQALRVRPPMEIAQVVYQVTDWLVRPLRRVLPSIGAYDWASLIGAYLIALLAAAFNAWLMGALFSPKIVLLLAILRICQWACYGLIGLIMIEVIFSWINPHAPLAPFVRALNEPLMRPLRRIVPMLGAFDLSPLIALILLRVAIQLVTTLIASLL